MRCLALFNSSIISPSPLVGATHLWDHFFGPSPKTSFCVPISYTVSSLPACLECQMNAVSKSHLFPTALAGVSSLSCPQDTVATTKPQKQSLNGLLILLFPADLALVNIHATNIPAFLISLTLCSNFSKYAIRQCLYLLHRSVSCLKGLCSSHSSCSSIFLVISLEPREMVVVNLMHAYPKSLLATTESSKSLAITGLEDRPVISQSLPLAHVEFSGFTL